MMTENKGQFPERIYGGQYKIDTGLSVALVLFHHISSHYHCVRSCFVCRSREISLIPSLNRASLIICSAFTIIHC